MLSKNTIYNKIILGTANLENQYGFLKSKLKKKELEKIILTTSHTKSLFIDTAHSYKNAEKIIGKLNSKHKDNLNIISKIPSLNNYQFPEKKILGFVNKSLKSLKIDKLYGILLHSSSDLLGKNGALIYNQLKLLKSKKIVKFIGISAYDKTQVNKIIKKFQIDIVQIPYSVFDRRFEKYNWMQKIRKKKIQLHIRSIFFQGLLTNPIFKKSKNFFFKEKLELWIKFCQKNNLNYNNAALNFVLKNNNINKILIGVKSNEEFLKNLIFKKNLKKLKYPKYLEIKDERLVDLSKIKLY